ncbi:hypothetical protein K523DRAFT_285602 [Schizophyllum commune Tattone D]|nr:hypothetical protein K523DRAFT_285602 [Schizophyllum commune Tattone D]
MSHSHQRRGPADIITYRYKERLVYVTPEKDYQAAVDMAIQEYAEELAGVPRESIYFYTMANMDGQRRAVRIGRSAWPRAMEKLVRGEVVDIAIRPHTRDAVYGLSGDATASQPPPQYLEVPGARESGRSRSPSPTPSERSFFRRVFGFGMTPESSRSSSPCGHTLSEKVNGV